MFARLGAFAYRRRGRVLLGWIIGLILAGGVGSGFTSKFGLPNGVESKKGLDILEARFGGVGAGQSGAIVLNTPNGSVTDPTVQSEFQAYLDEVAKIDGVAQVSSPYADGGAAQIASQGADAGKIAYASVAFPGDATQDDLKDTSSAIKDAAPTIQGANIEFGGQAFSSIEAPSSELL